MSAKASSRGMEDDWDVFEVVFVIDGRAFALSRALARELLGLLTSRGNAPDTCAQLTSALEAANTAAVQAGCDPA